MRSHEVRQSYWQSWRILMHINRSDVHNYDYFEHGHPRLEKFKNAVNRSTQWLAS